MNILHLDLKPIGNDYAEFRYFWENPNDYQSHRLPLAEIADLIQQAETDYYTRLPKDYAKTGQALYNWLDGSNRNLQRALDQHRRKGVVLAIAASQRLAHLPWEVLHDGKGFLVERRPAIIPIRWVKDGSQRQLTVEEQPKNRALNVLFMATAPLGIEPELDFEAEEAQILQATKRKPLSLTVEESGCLKELGYLVEDYDQGYFDVIHLTGHAASRGGKPCFITETEYGEAEYSSAEDIATELQFQLPKLFFLSGCRTGYSRDDGAVPSMAEVLLNQGATAILSWGDRVRDIDATATATALYEALSAGKTITEALALTYQVLISQQARDWHLLRLYVAETLPGALVTPLRTKRRKPAPRYSTTVEFRDPQGKLRVATRENFVGRRQLQNCLRTLKTDYEKVGVLIHGMGGLGKSTIASRLWDRLPEYEKVFWWRQIDESSLVGELTKKLIKPELRELRQNLQDSSEALQFKLASLFQELGERGEKPFLLVFDDFEWNLEHRQGRYVLKTEVAAVLKALVWAIQETQTDHRIIITCRYDFDSEVLEGFYKQPLDAFRKSDLQKKLSRLENFETNKVEDELINRAIRLADGNPRLLEWLNDEVLSEDDVDSKLSELEANSDEWKGKIIWEELYEQLDQTLENILSRCLVFEIPVPWSVLEGVCESISGYKEKLSRAIELGLIEVSSEPDESQRIYRVSRILPHIISTIRLPEVPEVYAVYLKASEELYEVWGNKENGSEEKWREIFRLAFADRENPLRFRQGFSRMLEVQFNSEADNAFESELRQVAEDLPTERKGAQLEDYLKQELWREADEETFWLFYQVMVQQGYENWDELCDKFPSDLLNEIDILWVTYSHGNFGFSVQKLIWKNVEGQPDSFRKQVGWYDGEWIILYDNLDMFSENYKSLIKMVGNLPCLWTMRGLWGLFWEEVPEARMRTVRRKSRVVRHQSRLNL